MGVDVQKAPRLVLRALRKMEKDGRVIAGAKDGQKGSGCYKIAPEEKERLRKEQNKAVKKLATAAKSKKPSEKVVGKVREGESGQEVREGEGGQEVREGEGSQEVWEGQGRQEVWEGQGDQEVDRRRIQEVCSRRIQEGFHQETCGQVVICGRLP